jgi:hypothetical protein
VLDVLFFAGPRLFEEYGTLAKVDTKSDIHDQRCRIEPDIETPDIGLKGRAKFSISRISEQTFHRYPISDIHGIPIDFLMEFQEESSVTGRGHPRTAE